MNSIINLMIVLVSIDCCHQNFIPEKNISIELTPLMATNETLIQEFKCDPESKVKQMTYFKYFPTTISCNDWSYKKTNTSFNITIGEEIHELDLTDVNTFTAHVNGQLILSQSGQIKDGICADGRFQKLVFNRVDPKACDEGGVTLQTTLYASMQIEGGFCQAFCFGHVTVKFSPGIKNF